MAVDGDNDLRVAESRTTGDRSAEIAERSAVGVCCRHAARMLEIADDGQPHTHDTLASIRAANAGQAMLLREAANISDEMLAALRESALQLQYLADKFGPTGTGAAVLARVEATVAKAEAQS